MAKTLEIDVPDAIHEALAARAEQDGLSVSAFVLRELQKQVIGTMDPDELLARLRQIPPIDLGELTAADLIHEGREERTNQVIDAVSGR